VNKLAHIYTIGEIVYDLIFIDNKPVSGTPGGAMLNTSVTLGRLGVPVNFISETGRDQIGEIILSFLQRNHISTHLIQRETNSKTALALAFLDQTSNASYDFYKHYPDDDFIISSPKFHPGDFFLFGSFFALTKRYVPTIKDLTRAAREAGSIVFYDPNFRKVHLNELDKLKPLIMENIRSADIIRGSDEDFNFIFEMERPEEIWGEINDSEKILIYTSNQKGVTLITHQIRKEYPVHKITPVSTIGAGDNFNAGIIHSLFHNKITRKEMLDLETRAWDDIISSGIGFGTMACLTMENYLTKSDFNTFSIH
jgi:fructokinase